MKNCAFFLVLKFQTMSSCGKDYRDMLVSVLCLNLSLNRLLVSFTGNGYN